MQESTGSRMPEEESRGSGPNSKNSDSKNGLATDGLAADLSRDEQSLALAFSKAPRYLYTAPLDSASAFKDEFGLSEGRVFAFPKRRAAWFGDGWLGDGWLRAAFAAAAVALIGVGTYSLSGERLDRRPSADSTSYAAGVTEGNFVVVSDPDMVLMDEIEMFDEVGNAPTRLVAEWGR